MRVISLCVEGYRNLRSFTFLPGPGVNVVYGDNAQGKTNLAEALWLFCGQKSFRGSRDGELVSFDGSAAKLKLRFFAEEREQESELLIDTARHASLNGVKLSSPTELSRRFCAVVFSPEHLSFVKEGPGVRRRFLDSAIIQLRPKYGSLLAGYHRAVKQRNVLLRDSVRHSELLELLSAYEYHIARFGAGILAKRRSYVEALRKEAPEIYKGLSGGKRLKECGKEDVPSLAAEYAQAMARLPKREKLLVTGGAYAWHRDLLEGVLERLEIACTVNEGADAIAGLKEIAEEKNG